MMNTSRILATTRMIAPRCLSQMTTTLSSQTLISASTAVRTFSSDPAQRLRSVFEEYRQEHYSDELPSRFKKDIIKAIPKTKNDNDATHNGEVVKVENLNTILRNIGRSDAVLSSEEVNVLLEEVDASEEASNSTNDGYVPLNTLLKLI